MNSTSPKKCLFLYQVFWNPDKLHISVLSQIIIVITIRNNISIFAYNNN